MSYKPKVEGFRPAEKRGETNVGGVDIFNFYTQISAPNNFTTTLEVLLYTLAKILTMTKDIKVKTKVNPTNYVELPDNDAV